MDFISKSDFSTVGGQPRAQDANNDFSQFAGTNNASGQAADDFFGAANDNQRAKTEVKNSIAMDLMDIFSQPAAQQAQNSNNLDDLFGASSSQPLAPSGGQ